MRKISVLGYLGAIDGDQVRFLIPWDRILPDRTTVPIQIRDENLREFISYAEVGFPPDCAIHLDSKGKIVEVVPGFFDPNIGISKILGYGLDMWLVYRGGKQVQVWDTPIEFYAIPVSFGIIVIAGLLGCIIYSGVRMAREIQQKQMAFLDSVFDIPALPEPNNATMAITTTDQSVNALFERANGVANRDDRILLKEVQDAMAGQKGDFFKALLNIGLEPEKEHRVATLFRKIGE